jgi:hypothetical protein
MSATVKAIVWLFWTFAVPFWTTVEAPFGPVIVQLTDASDSPPGNVSFMPTDPVPSDGAPPRAGSLELDPEQPTC